MERLGISLKVHYAPGEPHLAATTVVAAEGWIRYAVQHELMSFVFIVYVIPKKWLDKHGQKEEDNDRKELVEAEEEEEEDNYSDGKGDDKEMDDEDDRGGGIGGGRGGGGGRGRGR